MEPETAGGDRARAPPRADGGPPLAGRGTHPGPERARAGALPRRALLLATSTDPRTIVNPSIARRTWASTSRRATASHDLARAEASTNRPIAATTSRTSANAAGPADTAVVGQVEAAGASSTRTPVPLLRKPDEANQSESGACASLPVAAAFSTGGLV